MVSPWPNKRTNTSYTYINFKPSLHCTLYICHNFALPKLSERVYKIFWIAATRAENTQSCGETFLYSWENGMPNPQSKQCRVMLNNKYHNIIKSKVSVGSSDASLICYFCLISGWTWLNWRLLGGGGEDEDKRAPLSSVYLDTSLRSNAYHPPPPPLARETVSSLRAFPQWMADALFGASVSVSPAKLARFHRSAVITSGRLPKFQSRYGLFSGRASIRAFDSTTYFHWLKR